MTAPWERDWHPCVTARLGQDNGSLAYLEHFVNKVGKMVFGGVAVAATGLIGSCLLAGCSKSASLGSPWAYSEDTDKITNDSVVRAIGDFKDQSTNVPVKTQIEFVCEKSKGTDGLTVEVTTFDEQNKPKPMTGKVGIRLNGAALGGLLISS